MPAKVGSTTYVFKSRAEAAKFTGRIMRAQRQARGEKVSGISVGWAQLKSGLTRQVSLPDASTAAEYYAMQPLEADLTKMTEKELCTRKSTVYDPPPDFRWSRGNAKNNSRHIVVRHWSIPGERDSSLHTALSMEDKLAGINDYATWAPVAIRYSDWSVSRNPAKKLFAPLKKKLESFTSHDYPDPPASYREDKGIYISQKSKLKLIRGEKARSVLAITESQNSRGATALDKAVEKDIPTNDQPESTDTPTDLVTDEIIREARFKPMPFQKVSSKNDIEWQRRSEKHYLPCIGFDKDRVREQDKFVMFGLDLRKMRDNWHEIKDPYHPRHYYKKFSTDQNCSGICLSLLIKGGSRHFNSAVPKFVTTQANLQRYSARLIEKIDNLNRCSVLLDSKVRLYGVKKSPPMTFEVMCNQLASFPARYTMPSEWHDSFTKLASAIKALENPGQSIDDLIPIAEQIVTLITSLFHYTDRNTFIQDDMAIPALHAYRLLKEKMQEAYINENPDEQPDIN